MILAHGKTTVEEIWKQTDIGVTRFVSSLGTSGTMMSVGRALREKNQNKEIIEAQPEKGHHVPGPNSTDNNPEIYDPNMIDQLILITKEEL